MATRMSTRSFRCDDDVWIKARQRATDDERTMSSVIADLLEGYGKGYIDTPKIVKQYAGQKG